MFSCWQNLRHASLSSFKLKIQKFGFLAWNGGPGAQCSKHLPLHLFQAVFVKTTPYASIPYRWVYTGFSAWVNWALPSFCLTPDCPHTVGCKPLCPSCTQLLLLSVSDACEKCGQGECKEQHLDWSFSFDSTRYACSLEGVVWSLLRNFKYRYRPYWGEWLLEHSLIQNPSLTAYISTFDCIVPVPAFSPAKRERGFSSAEFLASYLARGHRKPLVLDCLKRVRGGSQVGKKRHSRLMNSGRYDLGRRSLPPLGKVLLVDDVWTTGSTAEECAQLLKKLGAGQVGVFTLFYAPKYDAIKNFRLELLTLEAI